MNIQQIYKMSLCLTMGLFTVILFGCASGTNSFDQIDETNSELRIFEVFGMDCPGCHGGLENLLNDIPGVTASQANWEQQQVKIIVSKSSSVSDDAVFEAIKKVNFTPGKRIQ